MSQHIQHLLNTWERRLRRQLDYSQLTNESLNDLEWTNDMLKACISAMREIAEKFDLTPQAPIVIEMPPPEALRGPGEAINHPNAEHGQNAPDGSEEVKQRLPATPSDHAQGLGDSTPSTPWETSQEQPSNTGTPKSPKRKGRNGSKNARKSDKSGKFSAALAKAGVSLVDQKPAPLPEPMPPAPVSESKPGADLTDPPAPKLSEIG